MTTDKQLYEEPYSRQMTVGRVRVHQSARFDKERTWQAAEVHWTAGMPVSADEAASFAAELLEAIDIARQWSAERTGQKGVKR